MSQGIAADTEILTERLLLRRPRPEDALVVNTAMNGVWDQLQKWMSWAYNGQNTMEATHEFIRSMGHTVLFGFCRKTGTFIVSTGLREEAPDQYQTGYWVAKDFLGKGYATEATQAMIDHAFTVMNAKAVTIERFEGNEKSRRVIEKTGFRPTVTLPKAHARCSNGELLDVHQYILKREDWTCLRVM